MTEEKIKVFINKQTLDECQNEWFKRVNFTFKDSKDF
jgi:hypothetical protein